MAAVQSTTEDWDNAWTLTMRVKRKRITDNISDRTNTLAYLRRSAVEFETGGKEIEEDIEHALGSAEWFGGHQSMNTNEYDFLTAAFFPWRYIAAPITISFDKEMESRAASGAIKLLEAKSRNAMKTIMDAVNSAIYGAQSGKSMLGLQDLVADAPTSGTVGGINRATHAFWRNQETSSTIDLDNLSGQFYDGVTNMQTQWNAASDGNESPDVAFTTLANYGDYQNILSSTGYSRFEAKDKTKGIFNGAPSFNGVPVLYDRDCSTDHLYFLNTEFIKLKVQTDVNFSKTPFRTPHDQFTKVAFIVFSCQLVINNPRRQSVMSVLQ
tara:strand:- start:1077 stop:2051 length:975 start_codon:yes stop_codon:yes gene_type:complete